MSRGSGDIPKEISEATRHWFREDRETMGSEYQRNVKTFISSLLLLLALGRWPVAATIPNGTITECSLSRLTFEFLESPVEDLDFLAACLDSKNRTCVAGKDRTSQMPNHVGDQITVTLSSTCDENLTATDPGLCTLQIVFLDFIDSIHSTSEHVCTLTPSIDSVTTSFKQTVNMYSSIAARPQNSLHPSNYPPLDSTVSIVVPLSLFITFLVTGFTVAVISLIVWTRHAQIKARRVIRIEEVVLDVSPSVLFGTGDDYLHGDNLTLYEDFNEGGDEENTNRAELTLKERLCSNGDDSNSSLNDSNIVPSTMQNSPPDSSLGYQYVAIRADS